MNKLFRTPLFRILTVWLALVFLAAVALTLLTLLTVLNDSMTFIAPVTYYIGEIIGLAIPLLSAMLFFSLARQGHLVALFPCMLLYFAVLTLCHFIESAFFCNYYYGELWETNASLPYLLDTSKETLGAVLLFGLSVLAALFIFRRAQSKGKDMQGARNRALLTVAAIFFVAAALYECFGYTVPLLRDVIDGFSVLQFKDALYIVFKYLFYLALAGIYLVLGRKIDAYVRDAL